jgi:rhodanese-related sulfurtransferase
MSASSLGLPCFDPDVEVPEAQAIIRSGAPVIDVREPDEFAAGAIQGSINVPLGEVQQAGIAALSNAGIDIEAAVLLMVCRSGNRSGLACSALRRALGDRTRNLAGGVIAWQAGGLPLVPGGKSPP